MLKTSKKRYFGTTCQVVSFSPSDVRLEPHNGVPDKRESIHRMWGSPKIGEVVCLKANGTFFNMGDPKSEIIGRARNDAFLNVAYDGKTFYMEPDIPQGLLEVSSSYPLLRNGQRERTNEGLLKTIIGINPRMIMGQRTDGEMVFITAEGRRLNERGLTSENERDVCLSEGVRNSVNNDGGGSTILIVNDKILNKAHDGRSLGYIWIGYRKWDIKELPKLKRGAKGMWVNLLQRMMHIDPDGDFGPVTDRTVRTHQQANGLRPTGYVDLSTWAAIWKYHKTV